ncbi:MAG: hypothetical protein BHV95_02130 [Clostridiales bacterium Nov_37_41]|nr:MAG: hypothetical protein BHV95_02130 [Clostridiales bacterium Nov_37_41]
MTNAQIAQKIKETCKSNNISISKMLTACKIRKSFIYDLEKRDYTPSIFIIESIANFFDCSIDYLMGRTDNPDSHKNCLVTRNEPKKHVLYFLSCERK